MNGVPNNQSPHNRSPLISISVSPRLRLYIAKTGLFLLFILVLIYVLIRDEVWRTAQQGSQIPGQSVKQGTMFTGAGIAGHSFTVNSSRTYHLSVRGSTASHIVINKLQGPAVYSSGMSKKRVTDFDEEVYLESGEYVVTLVATGKRPAKAFIELR